MKKWSTKPLGEISELYQPKTITSAEILSEGPYKVFGANGVIGFYDQYNHEESEVAVTCRGATCGTVNFTEPKSWITGNAMVVTPKDKYLDKRYLFYALKASDMATVISGSAQPQITRQSFAPMKIPVPPPADQERIVKLLDEADELRKLRAQGDRRADALVPALFHEMFSGGKFKSARVGELTSLVTSGSTPRGGDEVYTTEGPYFIRSQNVQMNRLDLTDAACLPADVHGQMTRTKVSVGDVLLNITGASIGRVTWVDKLDREANVSQHVCLIRPKSDLLNSTYLSVFISLPATQRFILQIQSGASRQALNHKQVRTLEIPLPAMPLQKEFAQRVTEIRELEASQATSRTRLDALFQSMLHRAFNGEL